MDETGAVEGAGAVEDGAAGEEVEGGEVDGDGDGDVDGDVDVDVEVDGTELEPLGCAGTGDVVEKVGITTRRWGAS